ncbi:MAG: DUF4160 domain-containing protein [Chloroflexi bacterium]|nr:MAG: DUF4160 domain-containing protein [Chloroflexota bacterium]
MPEISRFYGVVITMYPEAGERHSSPHMHARYGGSRATLSIETADLLAGSLPKPQLRMVQVWVELRGLQLEANWRLLIAGQPPTKIDPLR